MADLGAVLVDGAGDRYVLVASRTEFLLRPEDRAGSLFWIDEHTARTLRFESALKASGGEQP